MNTYSRLPEVELTHLPSGTKATANQHRSQHRNRDAAWAILKARVAAGAAFPLPLRATYTLPGDQPCPDDLAGFRTRTP